MATEILAILTENLPTLLALGTLAFAFTEQARKEIGKRDHWTCQGHVVGEECFWEKVTGKPAKFQDGYMVTAAHYPDVHEQTGKGYCDDNIENGRMLCTMDHAVEEIERGNEKGARLVAQMGVYTWERAAKEHKQIYPQIEKLRILAKAHDRLRSK